MSVTSIPMIAPTEAHLTAVGRVAARWQYLDWYTDQAIWALAGIDEEQGWSFTRHMNYPLKCDVLASLFSSRVSDKEANDALRALRKKADDCSTKRNKFIHALWLTSPKPGHSTLVEKPRRSRPDTQVSQVSVSEINKTADDLERVSIELINFFRRYGIVIL